jgi:ribosomal peptide maturation radical SAM protein 1
MTDRAFRTDEVALVNMPFALLEHPPLGLGLLKAGLARRGIGARVWNLNLRFGRRIGEATYSRMAMSHPTALAGEWAFSAALWGEDAESDARYARDVLGNPLVLAGADGGRVSVDLHETMAAVRAAVLPFLEECVDEVPWESYRIVGFTSVFEQHVASLSLARRIKERYPSVFLVVGGANCEGAMGAATFRAFPFLDAVCSGEGDLVFPEMVERYLAGRPIGDIPGILYRRPAGRAARLPTVDANATAAQSVHDMDALPIPDFDDYFTEVKGSEVKPRLVFETSRGCWWGAKQHCTFCGLNGATMAFREKSAGRAIEELTFLLERYGSQTRAISAVDNIIPLQYFKDFLPKLKEMKLDLELFYETKSNLKKEQVELYRAAGLTQIQPGIESLSTPVLRLMRKGVTRLQNVQLLKWCAQFGVAPMWNYIIGFPGERPEDYAGQDDLVRAVAHLPSPDGWGMVRFDRFSPYFTQPESFGLRNLRPYPAYSFVYRGLAEDLRRDLAYYFQAEYDGLENVPEYTAPLTRALDDWIANGKSYALFSMSVGRQLHVFDLRPGVPPAIVPLEGLARAVYEACDRITSRSQLPERVAEPGSPLPSAASIDAALAVLVERRLVISEGDNYLALGVPLGYEFAPQGPARKRVIEAMKSLG